jgi:hypothetical protein
LRFWAWLAIIAMGLGLLLPGATGATVMELSGNEWLRLSETAQDFYVIGVYDGFVAGYLRAYAMLLELQQPDSARALRDRLGRLLNCTEQPGVTRGQYVAIVRQYVREHPAEWHYVMSGLILNALAACKP